MVNDVTLLTRDNRKSLYDGILLEDISVGDHEYVIFINSDNSPFN